jgi:hypothetical protein
MEAKSELFELSSPTSRDRRVLRKSPSGAVSLMDPSMGFVRTRYLPQPGIRRFRGHGGGTVVGQSWRLLRLDPVLGSTRVDLNALRDYMAASAEKTLASLAEWITKNQVRQAPRRNRK